MQKTDEKWDHRFLEMAHLVANWSKDPRRKVGAVIVKDRLVLSCGYNGFPRGLSDSLDLYANREFKNQHVVHAEANAIYNCPVKPENATIYCTYAPCLACSLAIIQSGISTVVCPPINPDGNWSENQREAEYYMSHAGVRSIHLIKPEPEYMI